MAVGTLSMPSLKPIAGVTLGTAMAGIRRVDRRDLLVIMCEPGTTAAAGFTQSQFAAPPVILARAHLARCAPRALVVNTGYANAATGEHGFIDAQACCDAVAVLAQCTPEQVLPFSTGVIGERLPTARLIAGLPAAFATLRPDGWDDAAQAILTTDTVPKGASTTIPFPQGTVTLTGIAKGSGMIHPNMATMLSFIATDIQAPASVLKSALDIAMASTFNAITVDGDTSTNDAVVLLATGQSGIVMESSGAVFARFVAVLEEICMKLAHAIVRDGEGATKFIRVEVSGGRSVEECRVVANTIALSPLVKTALFAGDPNWGRILMAIGRAPIAPLDVSRVVVSLNGIRVFMQGAVDPSYKEEFGQKALAGDDITIHVDLGHGASAARVYTCDLSHEYVRINGSYRT